jgi:type II secretory pathway component GspD/PulD (secretin)
MKKMMLAGIFGCGVLATNVGLVAQVGASQPNVEPTPREKYEARQEAMEIRTFHLKDTTLYDMNDLITILRNIFTNDVRIYSDPTAHVVVIKAGPQDIAKAEQLITELDKPTRSYRLTYRLTQIEVGKKVGDQVYSFIVFSGKSTQIKEGSRVPISLGTTGTPGGAQGGQQLQYLDVGLNIEATADAYADGVKVQTKMEQSSLAEEKQGAATDDPVIRQTDLEGTAIVTPGKPVVLGSLDIPGSTRHQEVELSVEVLP